MELVNKSQEITKVLTNNIGKYSLDYTFRIRGDELISSIKAILKDTETNTFLGISYSTDGKNIQWGFILPFGEDWVGLRELVEADLLTILADPLSFIE